MGLQREFATKRISMVANRELAAPKQWLKSTQPPSLAKHLIRNFSSLFGSPLSTTNLLMRTTVTITIQNGTICVK
jgi:hypothetical protein